MRQTPKRFEVQENVLKVLYHHAKFGEARISPPRRHAGAAKNVEFLQRAAMLALQALY